LCYSRVGAPGSISSNQASAHPVNSGATRSRHPKSNRAGQLGRMIARLEHACIIQISCSRQVHVRATIWNPVSRSVMTLALLSVRTRMYSQSAVGSRT